MDELCDELGNVFVAELDAIWKERVIDDAFFAARRLSALETVAAGRSCLVVSDDNVAALYGDKLHESLLTAGATRVEQTTFPAGETSKNLATVAAIYTAAINAGLDRDSIIVALGGGVVGDTAGFVAASYMRGIRLLQVPTSLVAQVDSAVGGKTGVNHPQGKNLIGAFHQPQIVLVDTDTLATLPDRELKAGLAEVIKYGAIADVEFFAWLETNADALILAAIRGLLLLVSPAD